MPFPRSGLRRTSGISGAAIRPNRNADLEKDVMVVVVGVKVQMAAQVQQCGYSEGENRCVSGGDRSDEE